MELAARRLLRIAVRAVRLLAGFGRLVVEIIVVSLVIVGRLVLSAIVAFVGSGNSNDPECWRARVATAWRGVRPRTDCGERWTWDHVKHALSSIAMEFLDLPETLAGWIASHRPPFFTEFTKRLQRDGLVEAVRRNEVGVLAALWLITIPLGSPGLVAVVVVTAGWGGVAAAHARRRSLGRFADRVTASRALGSLVLGAAVAAVPSLTETQGRVIGAIYFALAASDMIDGAAARRSLPEQRRSSYLTDADADRFLVLCGAVIVISRVGLDAALWPALTMCIAREAFVMVLRARLVRRGSAVPESNGLRTVSLFLGAVGVPFAMGGFVVLGVAVWSLAQVVSLASALAYDIPDQQTFV